MTQVATAMMSRTSDIEVRYQLLNAELQRRQLEIKNRLPMQKTIDSFQTIATRDGNITTDISLILEEATRNNVQVSSMTYDSTGITVICQGSDSEAFRSFLSALEEIDRFVSASPPPEGYPFATGGTVKIKLKTGK